MQVDSYGRIIYKSEDIVDIIYNNPDLNLSKIFLNSADATEYNNSINELYSNIEKCLVATKIDVPADEFHQLQQQNWHMPEEYKKLDIAKWLLDKCSNDTELQRVGQELLLYQDRNLFELLKFLKYFVDTCKKNNIVLGVGRGSSVASYILYLIGIHRIDSLYYNLDIHEFLR